MDLKQKLDLRQPKVLIYTYIMKVFSGRRMSVQQLSLYDHYRLSGKYPFL